MNPDQLISLTTAKQDPEQLEEILDRFGVAIITRNRRPLYTVMHFYDPEVFTIINKTGQVVHFDVH